MFVFQAEGKTWSSRAENKATGSHDKQWGNWPSTPASWGAPNKKKRKRVNMSNTQCFECKAWGHFAKDCLKKAKHGKK